MSESKTIEGITQEILEEHRQIHFYLDQIEVTLQGLTAGMTDVEPLRRLAAQLEGLRERVREHQQGEEQGGLYQALLEALPGCRVEITRLMNQHEKMIKILEMARIHAQCGELSEAIGLREDLMSFLQEFRRHEREEEGLMRRAIERRSQPTD